eukprot:7086090-Prymnesium_polylepis.2
MPRQLKASGGQSTSKGPRPPTRRVATRPPGLPRAHQVLVAPICCGANARGVPRHHQPLFGRTREDLTESTRVGVEKRRAQPPLHLAVDGLVQCRMKTNV